MAPRSINAAIAGDLQRGIKEVNKDLVRLTREISGADSEPVKQAANALRTEWRRLLSVQGSGRPAPPGTPPHRQSSRLYKSIRHAVVDGVRRIGSGNFRAWMTEFGTDQAPPRPHARPALENAAEQMGEVLVSESQRAIEKAPA